MIAEEVETLETTFGVTLPDRYVELLLEYPEDLVATKTDLGWKQESIADRQLLNDATKLCKLNEFVRCPGTPWTDDDGPWPNRFFAIGDNECGDYWAVDTSDPNSPVYFYDHDRGTFARQFGSAQEFGTWLVGHVREWNARHGRN
jgi:hypothetical protein